jgi:predicted GNAT family acetyltransferase
MRFSDALTTDVDREDETGARLHRITVQRCLDARAAAKIIRQDYYDEPMPYLTNGIIQTLARDWITGKKEVYLLTVEVDGNYAGFVFGHRLGPRFWRLVAQRHTRHLPALLWARVRLKLGNRMARHPSPVIEQKVEDVDAQVAALSIPALERPFSWSAANDYRTGIIPLVFVHPDYRGHGLAQSLLKELVNRMFADGAESVEAHIDAQNLSSVRAFLKSGWEVYRMSSKDFWARKSAQG